MMSIRYFVAFFVAAAVSACATSTSAPGAAKHVATDQTAMPTPPQADVLAARGKDLPPLPADPQRFATELAAARSLDLSKIQAALAEARYNATVARLIAPPARAASATPPRRNWPAYRARFVEPVRIRHGVAFWRENADRLAAAEQHYGVPASVIVAIIGVETVYGRNMGNFRVLDALYTLAFSYPEHARRDRSEYFRGELGEFLSMTQKAGVDPTGVLGSYAGAIGIPQFMPGSIRRYAVAAEGGVPDLAGNPADAIESVANYLVEHGWQRDLPVFARVNLPADPSALVDGGLEPTLNWRQLVAAGATAPGVPAMAGVVSGHDAGSNAWRSRPLGVINLDHGASPRTDYRVATENFFTITKYNRSYFYATAVADLAQTLETAYQK